MADSTRIVFNSDGSTTRFINNKKDTTFKGRWNAPSMTKADSDAQKRRLAYAKNVSSPKARQQQSVIGETFAVTRPTDEGGTITVTRGGKVTVRDSERKVVERFQGDDSSVKDFLVRQKKSSKRVKDEEAEKQQLKRLLKSVIVTPKGKSEASARLKVLDAPVFLRDVKKLRGFQIEKTIKDYNKGVVKRGVLEPVKKLRELQLSAIEERERQPKFTSLESLNEYILGKKGEEKFARKLKLDVVARNIRIASRTPISDVVGKGVERKVLGAVLPFISKDKVDKVASTLGKFRDKTKAVIGVAVAETVERPLQDLELYKAGKFLKKSIGFAGEVVEKIGERFPKVGKVLKFTGKGASVSIASAYAGGGGGVYAGGSAGVGGCSSAGNGTVGGKGLNAINETGSGGGGGDGGNGGGDGGSGIIIISFISSSTLNITDSSYNLTSDGGCSVWNTSKSNVCNTTDGTPNIVFDTNFNANCSFSTTSGNYNSSLICSTTDSTSHSCNIYYAERLAYGLDSLYASCYDGTTQVTSGALAINMTAGTPGNVTTSCTVDYGNWRFIPNGCVI